MQNHATINLESWLNIFTEKYIALVITPRNRLKTSDNV